MVRAQLSFASVFATCAQHSTTAMDSELLTADC